MAMWEAKNTQLNEDLETRQERAREEYGFDWGEVESKPQIEEAIVQRLVDCESTLDANFSESEIGQRVTGRGSTVDELRTRSDP